MTEANNRAAPQRGPQHEKLAMFLGEWRAEGHSYGSPQQDPADPKGKPESWISTHSGMWHSGEFFLIQDEHARTGPDPFDTLSVMGVDGDSGRYFARSFENHGFSRDYEVDVQGDVWTLTGHSERARIEFAPDHRTQTIHWEWLRDGRWLPLCDRTARRID